MKKHEIHLVAFSLLLTLLSVNPRTGFGQLPFYDGFESGDFYANNWMVAGTAGGYPDVVMQMPSQGTYCAKGFGNYAITHQFPGLSSGLITVEFDARMAQLDKRSLLFLVQDSVYRTGPGVVFSETGEITVSDSLNWFVLDTYAIGQWYSVRIVTDFVAETFDVFIDGQLLGDDIGFYNSGFSSPFEFGWGSLEFSGEAFVDEIRIYEGLTGVAERNTEPVQLNIYPNPVAGSVLQLDLDQFQGGMVQVLDGPGRIRWKNDGPFMGPTIEIPVDDLPCGVYLLRYHDNAGQTVGTARFQKR